MARSPSGLSTGAVGLDLPDASVAFDPLAFDEAVFAHGVEFLHEMSVPDPVGLVTKDDVRRPDPHSRSGANGRLYVPAGCFRALLTGNSKELRAAEQGNIDSAVASLTPTRHYLDRPDCRVRLHPGDRMFLRTCDVEVVQHQLVDRSETGKDRLRFPALRVDVLVDSAGVSFSAGSDFDVVAGDVVWRPGARPGRVYSVRYTYRPHWYVDRLLHDVRVAQATGGDGETSVIQLNQAAVVQREYLYRAEAQDPQASVEPQPRAGASAPDAYFGPR